MSNLRTNSDSLRDNEPDENSNCHTGNPVTNTEDNRLKM
jgi:hypothetical protein